MNLRNEGYEIIEIAVVVVVEAMERIEVFIFESRRLRHLLFFLVVRSTLHFVLCIL